VPQLVTCRAMPVVYQVISCLCMFALDNVIDLIISVGLNVFRMAATNV